MNTAKHTPGPWKIGGDNKTLVHGNDKLMVLAECKHTHIVKEWCRPIETAQANARLIAAAPELLRAAKDCQNLSDRCNNAMLAQSVQDLLKAINETLTTAINKATGE